MIIEETDKSQREEVEVRKFGITIAIAFAILSGFFWWRGKEYYIYCVALSLAFLLFTLIAPAVLKPAYKAWMFFAMILNFIMTRIIDWMSEHIWIVGIFFDVVIFIVAITTLILILKGA